MSIQFAGIDIGSRTIELVVVDKAGNITDSLQTDTGFNPMIEAQKLLENARFDHIMATGYGRNLFEISFEASTVTEIKAHARGALAFFRKLWLFWILVDRTVRLLRCLLMVR